MISDRDSNGVLTRKQKEELVLNLYFNQNKTYHEISKIARISPRDIKPIIDKAINEKERTEHKSTAVQAYELYSKGKTLLEVTIEFHLQSHLQMASPLEISNLHLLLRACESESSRNSQEYFTDACVS
jgi:predicted DNA-binding protein YlxM (UPF0122 family)